MRSGREHCGSRVAVGRGRRGRRGRREDDKDDKEDEEEEERRTRQEEAEEEEEATDIKSNNPHLAGGERTKPKQTDENRRNIRNKTQENQEYLIYCA